MLLDHVILILFDFAEKKATTNLGQTQKQYNPHRGHVARRQQLARIWEVVPYKG